MQFRILRYGRVLATGDNEIDMHAMAEALNADGPVTVQRRVWEPDPWKTEIEASHGALPAVRRAREASHG